MLLALANETADPKRLARSRFSLLEPSVTTQQSCVRAHARTLERDGTILHTLEFKIQAEQNM